MRRGEEIISCTILSGIYGMLGDFQRSMAFQEQVLNVAREHNDQKGQAMALQGLANSYFLRGEFDKAQGFFQQSFDLGRQIGDRTIEVGALQGLGSIAFARGNYRKAIDYWQKYLDIIQTLDEWTATLTGINRQLEGMGLQFLARAYATAGQHAKGIDLADQALRLAQASKNAYEIAGALDALGYTLFVSGKLPEAEKTLRQALQKWETVRVGLGEADLEKVSLLDVQTTTYDLLQQVLVAQNKPHEALEIAERGRARAFVDALMTRPSRTSVGKVQLDSPGIEGIHQLAKEIDATLVEYSIIYDPTKVLLPGRIRGEQAFLEDELLIWVVQPSDEIVFRRVDLKPLRQQGTSLTQLVGSSRNRIEGRGVIQLSDAEEGPKKPFQRLYELLIQPINDLLPSNPEDRVVFIPQGPLFLLSFPALTDPSDHYLIERHTIQTAPSIGVLASLPKAGKKGAWKPSDVLIVGNPAMAPELKGEPFLLGNLTGAEREAHAIAQQFQTRAITGEQASKQVIVRQMPQVGLIHMASHGLLKNMGSRGLPGALVLAPSGEDNGLLTAAEIMDMQLNADLVVLSACDTGRGRITGDGVVGLARSFITAGVPSVVVSLWAIPDSPTAFLMTEFYRHLKIHPDTAQALRQAMLAAIDRNYNPGEWAAFTLIGRL